MKKNIFNFDFLKSMSIWEYVLMAIFLIGQILLTIFFDNTVINYIIFVFGFLYIVCASHVSFWIFIFGTIQPILFAIVCYKSGLYGEMVLNLCGFVPLQIVGFVSWLNNNSKLTKASKSLTGDYKEENNNTLSQKINNNNSAQIAPRVLNIKQILCLFPIVIVAFFIVYFALNSINTQKTALLDSIITVASLLGTLLLSFRFLETWWVYLVVNIVSTVLWTMHIFNGNPDAPSMLLTQLSYVIWTVLGLKNWLGTRKSLNN